MTIISTNFGADIMNTNTSFSYTYLNLPINENDDYQVIMYWVESFSQYARTCFLFFENSWINGMNLYPEGMPKK
jgi:hypothetical protein